MGNKNYQDLLGQKAYSNRKARCARARLPAVPPARLQLRCCCRSLPPLLPTRGSAVLPPQVGRLAVDTLLASKHGERLVVTPAMLEGATLTV